MKPLTKEQAEWVKAEARKTRMPDGYFSLNTFDNIIDDNTEEKDDKPAT